LSLSQSESQLLVSLRSFGGKADAISLARSLGLPLSSIFPLSSLLESKGYVKTREIVTERFFLTDEGRYCLKNGLPESRMVDLLSSRGGEMLLDELKASLKPDEFSAALGWGRRSGAVRIEKKEGKQFAVLVKPQKPELEGLLAEISSEPEKSLLDQAKQAAVLLLTERGLAEPKIAKQLFLELIRCEDAGAAASPSANVLTSDVIKSGEWKGVSLRPYDVAASPPVLKIGKKHPYIEFLHEAREILLAMGFEETAGPYVESEFWNFDVLYMAQDHPARAVHDNFQVRGVDAAIDAPDALIKKVQSVHETGAQTGSKGWGYKWDMDIARRQILRTHTTAVSVRSLSIRKVPPVKTFCLSKVFRPDVIDPRHMLEFSQLDGILGDQHINVRHLLGVLTEFAQQLGFKEIRFTPGYFPFTEPSIEAYVKHPKLGWIECLGSGLFRPEVLAPLGIRFPVIAWGIGIDRLAMIRLGLEDIRDLHSGSIDFLRQWRWW